MKVSELIRQLTGLNPDAKVFLATHGFDDDIVEEVGIVQHNVLDNGSQKEESIFLISDQEGEEES
jgi:hypothetical protein